MHIAINELTLSKLIPNIKKLMNELKEKEKQFKKIIKNR